MYQNFIASRATLRGLRGRIFISVRTLRSTSFGHTNAVVLWNSKCATWDWETVIVTPEKPPAMHLCAASRIKIISNRLPLIVTISKVSEGDYPWAIISRAYRPTEILRFGWKLQSVTGCQLLVRLSKKWRYWPTGRNLQYRLPLQSKNQLRLCREFQQAPLLWKSEKYKKKTK